MQVRVQLSGAEALIAGCDEVAVDLPSGPTCSTLRDLLADMFPLLRPLLPAARFAINRQPARGDQQLEDGDEVAVIGQIGRA